ncbi:hypothetical protein Q1695_005140 [Nippostrongylus brasiliensis]|nr:hypothetical protein Q1695_005140 [Nippostrongylus brasiliensis]
MCSGKMKRKLFIYNDITVIRPKSRSDGPVFKYLGNVPAGEAPEFPDDYDDDDSDDDSGGDSDGDSDGDYYDDYDTTLATSTLEAKTINKEKEDDDDEQRDFVRARSRIKNAGDNGDDPLTQQNADVPTS